MPAAKKKIQVGMPLLPVAPFVFIITDVVIPRPTTDNRVVTQ